MLASTENLQSQENLSGCRISENIFFGEIPALVIENDLLRLTILEGRGADVVQCLYKPTALDLVWLTQWGIPTTLVPDDYPANVDSFLNGYPGGWQSIFPNGGAPSSVNGIDFAQHDEVALLSWRHEILHDSEEMCEVRFSVETRKTQFRVSKTFRLRKGETKCVVTEEIENLSDDNQRAMWGFHISFGAPFVDQNTTIRLPNNVTVIPHDAAIASTGRRLDRVENFTWPIFTKQNGENIDFSALPAQGTESEMLYLHGFDDGWYQIENWTNNLAMKVSWDLELMPYLWYWQEYGSSQDYPWFGKHYNIGLEPFSSFPTNGLAQAIENGTALTFHPREKKASVIEIEVMKI